MISLFIKKEHINQKIYFQGSYWAVDEPYESDYQIKTRKRKVGFNKEIKKFNHIHSLNEQYDEIQQSPHNLPTSPAGLIQHPPGFCTSNNPMICGDVSSVGGQSSSTDESDSTISLVANVNNFDRLLDKFFLLNRLIQCNGMI